MSKAVKFDFIRYANCWEDAEILFQAMKIKEGGYYLSIASAGDNAFNLLRGNPALILAVDLNPAQLACCELRKAAFQNLSYDEVLKFLGVNRDLDRLKTYQDLSGCLTPEARKFWDNNLNLIASGIIHSGKFERFFKLFRSWILPLIHNQAKIDQLLLPKSSEQRSRFYMQEWDTWRWRIFFKIFFSRFVLGHLGRDPEFFKFVKGDVVSRIIKRAEYALTVLPPQTNPYLEYILKGNFIGTLPAYLQPQNFEVIRQNLDKLKLEKGSLEDVLDRNSGLRFDGFNLSDIFEYMGNPKYLEELERIIVHSKQGARLVYWNMLAERKSPQDFHSRLKPLEELARDLFLQDQAFFYQALIIEEVL